MDKSKTFEAHKQSAKAMKPSKGSLDHPTVLSEMGRTLNPPSGNAMFDAPLSTGHTALGVIIPFVPVEFLGTVRRTASLVPQSRNQVQHGFEHIGIMYVGCC